MWYCHTQSVSSVFSSLHMHIQYGTMNKGHRLKMFSTDPALNPLRGQLSAASLCRLKPTCMIKAF